MDSKTRHHTNKYRKKPTYTEPSLSESEAFAKMLSKQRVVNGLKKSEEAATAAALNMTDDDLIKSNEKKFAKIEEANRKETAAKQRVSDGLKKSEETATAAALNMTDDDLIESNEKKFAKIEEANRKETAVAKRTKGAAVVPIQGGKKKRKTRKKKHKTRKKKRKTHKKKLKKRKTRRKSYKKKKSRKTKRRR